MFCYYLLLSFFHYTTTVFYICIDPDHELCSCFVPGKLFPSPSLLCFHLLQSGKSLLWCFPYSSHDVVYWPIVSYSKDAWNSDWLRKQMEKHFLTLYYTIITPVLTPSFAQTYLPTPAPYSNGILRTFNWYQCPWLQTWTSQNSS
jgi:hypothetical protein